jgi:hypothetical protein
MKVTDDGQPPEVPAELASLVRDLERHAFQTTYRDETPQAFGNFVQVLERPPLSVRIVRDRGQWRAEFTAKEWPRHPQWGEEWVPLGGLF